MARGGKRPGAGRKPGPRPEAERPKRLPWRPSKYDPSYCDLVIELMQKGLSLTGFAGKIGVSRSTVSLWAKEYPDFSEATNVGKAVRAATWEEHASRVAQSGGGPGTAQIIIFALKNMAPDEYAEGQNAKRAEDDSFEKAVAADAPVLAPDERSPDKPIL